MNEKKGILPKPPWLRSQLVGGKISTEVAGFIREYSLATVCDHARCPNRGECYDKGTATFLLLGEICTRSCRFCAVNHDTAQILPPNPTEPDSVAEMAKRLNLRHVVLTMVTRDDLPDGGASHIAATIRAIRTICGEKVTVEALISDLAGNENALSVVLNAKPTVLNHNMETVKRLYPKVRPQADYQRSLRLLERVAVMPDHPLVKSGFMVGLGETGEEVETLLKDLRRVGVNLVTIGQYLAPSGKHLPVEAYIHPDEFARYAGLGMSLGFTGVESAPLVRSSYHAEKWIELATGPAMEGETKTGSKP